MNDPIKIIHHYDLDFDLGNAIQYLQFELEKEAQNVQEVN